ncbi:hypothetical protein ACLB2K_019955 [Fragaria x ananassa]
MESRRLSILCSHLRPGSGPSLTRQIPVSRSICGAGSTNTNQQPSDCDLNDCVFCKIIRGESPAFKIYEDDICLCILDTHPLSRGHSLIIPKSHFPSLKATPPAVVAAMCSKVPFISSAILKATGSDSFNLLVNTGTAAGQVIFHTHIHIIPREALDCLWASESLRRRPLNIDQEASRLADRVREQLSLPDNSGDSKDEGSSLTGN